MHTLQCDLRLSAAKLNSITHAAAAARNLDAAIPIRSAETELLNAIQLHTMATQIAARKPDRRPRTQTTIFKHFFKEILKENHQRENGEKLAAKAQFATFTQPLQYDLRQGLAKQNQNRKTALENKYPSRNLGAAIPLLSAQTGLHNTKELQHTIVEHIASIHQFQCTTCRNMQNTIAQYQQKTEKVTWNHQFHCTRSSRQIRRQSNDARQPLRKRANFSPQRTLCLPEKTQCFVQILTFKSHPWCSSSNAICQQRLANHKQNRKALLQTKYHSSSLGEAMPLRSAQTEFHNTKELQHNTVEYIASIHQFPCTTCRNTCKTQ